MVYFRNGNHILLVLWIRVYSLCWMWWNKNSVQDIMTQMSFYWVVLAYATIPFTNKLCNSLIMQFSTVIQNQSNTNVVQIPNELHMSRYHEHRFNVMNSSKRQVSGMNLFDDSFTELNRSERLLNQHLNIWSDIRNKLSLFSAISISKWCKLFGKLNIKCIAMYICIENDLNLKAHLEEVPSAVTRACRSPAMNTNGFLRVTRK